MALFHKYNKELVTPNLSPITYWFRFNVGASGAVGTIYEARAGFISSIVRNSAGNYTVTLTRPFPPAVLNVRPTVNRAAVTDAFVRADYDANSYSATAGTFVIQCSGDTAVNNTAQIAADPVSGSEMHVEVVFVGRNMNIGV